MFGRLLALAALLSLVACSGERFLTTPNLTLTPGQMVVNTLKCETHDVVAKPGSRVLVRWSGTPSSPLSFVKEQGVCDGCRIVPAGGDRAELVTPSFVEHETALVVYPQQGGKTLVNAGCRVKLKASAFGAPDDGQRGLVGAVYQIPEIARLDKDQQNFATIDMDSRTPLSTRIVAPNLDVKERPFDAGFPGGAEELEEWFAIRFKGKFTAPATGEYTFGLVADDGAQLFLNGQLNVNHDGRHRSLACDSNGRNCSEILKQGTKVTLTKDQVYNLRVDYFQGPRLHIALRVMMKKPGSSRFEPVPKELLNRPE